MASGKYIGLSTFKLVFIGLILLAIGWVFLYTELKLNHWGILFELGDLLYYAVWHICYYGILLIFVIDLISMKGRIIFFGNLLFYLLILTFYLNAKYNISQLWVFE